MEFCWNLYTIIILYYFVTEWDRSKIWFKFVYLFGRKSRVTYNVLAIVHDINLLKVILVYKYIYLADRNFVIRTIKDGESCSTGQSKIIVYTENYSECTMKYKLIASFLMMVTLAMFIRSGQARAYSHNETAKGKYFFIFIFCLFFPFHFIYHLLYLPYLPFFM